MKKNAYENSRLKRQLLERKSNGQKEVIWSLKPAQKEYIETSLGLETEAVLYEVKTKTFYNINELNAILKKIHFSNKRGKKVIVLKLNSNQLRVLDEFDVYYRPYKYRIILAS